MTLQTYPSIAKKKLFDDVQCSSLSIGSSWLLASQRTARKAAHTQTPAEFHNHQEREVQSGRYTRIIQDQVSSVEMGVNIVEHLCKKHGRLWEARHPDIVLETWREKVSSGMVTLDCEVVNDADTKLDADAFIEFVDFKSHAATQTEKLLSQDGIAAEPKSQSRSEGKDSKHDSKREKSNRNGLSQFLEKVTPLVLEALKENDSEAVFDSISSIALPQEEDTQNITCWKTLSVDLEKRKVIYPDWNKAKYHSGFIVNCISTRNKERIYDVEFDDGSKLYGVREEYIRLIEEDASHKGRSKIGADMSKRATVQLSRLQEGIRVHAKILSKGGYKYLPGRIVKISRNTFDVECEGRKVESGLGIDDLCIGLVEGQRIEARKPHKVQLQCTGMCWNSTGNMVASAYGKNDIVGWCNFPGAVCIWNIFGKEFDSSNPDFVFDHPSCIMSVSYHPFIPSIIAAGSYNGEIIVWDLSAGDNLLAISPITEYSHKEPVVALRWVFNSQTGSDNWWLVSVSTDGKVLFWSLANKLQHPMKGYLLQKPKLAGTRIDKHNLSGASSFTFSCGSSCIKQIRPKWIVVGHVGGSISRAQVSKLGGNPLNAEMLKLNPNVTDLYGALQRADDSFTYENHIGAVCGIDWSPFHRNLFLCAGIDGKVKLFHILEQSPIRTWEPLLHVPNTQNDLALASITGISFSPVRPLLFAVSSSNGYIFIFDLSETTGKPVAIHFIDSNQDLSSTEERKVSKSSKSCGACLASLAFNHKQRDLIGVCDFQGRVHIVKLCWKLANRQIDEQAKLEDIGNLTAHTEET